MENNTDFQTPDGFIPIDEELMSYKQSNPDVHWLEVIRWDEDDVISIEKTLLSYAGFKPEHYPEILSGEIKGRYWLCSSFTEAQEWKNKLEEKFDVKVRVIDLAEFGGIMFGPDFFESEDK